MCMCPFHCSADTLNLSGSLTQGLWVSCTLMMDLEVVRQQRPITAAGSVDWVHNLEKFYWPLPESCPEGRGRAATYGGVYSSRERNWALYTVSLSWAFNNQEIFRSNASFPENYLAICLMCHLNVNLLSYVTFSISTLSIVLSWREPKVRCTCACALLTSISFDLWSHHLPQSTTSSRRPFILDTSVSLSSRS